MDDKTEKKITKIEKLHRRNLEKKKRTILNLQNLIIQGMPIFQTSQNKDIFLVIGNLGAGKSTAVNYFMSNRMRLEEAHGVDRIVVQTAIDNQIKLPVIGHSLTYSQTLYPQTYTTVEGINLCDSPGFMGNRRLEESVCESISMELSVKLAKSIQGVLVVIDYTEFYVARGAGFRYLIDILSKLFGADLDRVSKSLFFVITKKPRDISCEAIKKRILKIIKESIELREQMLSENYKAHQGEEVLDEKDEEEDALFDEQPESNYIEDTALVQLRCLKLIEQRQEYLVVIDVLDQGESWRQVYQSILKLSPIDISLFDFKKYDDMRIHFNQMIYDLIDTAIGEIKDYYACNSQLESYHSSEKDHQSKVDFYTKQIDFIKNNPDLSIIKEQEKVIKDEIEKNDNKILSSEKAIQEINGQDKLTLRKLEEIDTTMSVKYWEDSIFEKRHPLFGLLSWTVKHFNYSGIPIKEIKLTIKSGRFYNEILNTSQGKYTATYKSNFGADGDAKVEIYVQSKNEPGNMKNIALLKKELEKNQIQRNELTERVRKLESENLKFKTLLTAAQEKDTEERQKKIEEYQDEINKSTQAIFKIKHEMIEKREKLEVIKVNIHNNLPLFEVVEKILTVISSDSSLVQSFLDELIRYRKTLSGITTENNSSAKLLENITQKNENSNLKNLQPSSSSHGSPISQPTSTVSNNTTGPTTTAAPSPEITTATNISTNSSAPY